MESNKQRRRTIPRYLTDAEVEVIRVQVKAGVLQGDLARQYGVSLSTVSRIVNRHRRVEPMEES